MWRFTFILPIEWLMGWHSLVAPMAALGWIMAVNACTLLQ
jgi:hypothetical protein